MHKRFSSLLIITIFLAMQALSLLHMGEYDFAKHEHNGQTCDISLHADNDKCAIDIAPSLHIDKQPVLHTSFIKLNWSTPKQTKDFDARAPPSLA